MEKKRSSASTRSRTHNKEPVLQIFVMPTGLPKQALRVSVHGGDATAPLACTHSSARRDPLFGTLWEEKREFHVETARPLEIDVELVGAVGHHEHHDASSV